MERNDWHLNGVEMFLPADGVNVTEADKDQVRSVLVRRLQDGVTADVASERLMTCHICISKLMTLDQAVMTSLLELSNAGESENLVCKTARTMGLL
jgi:hypothetical protein